MPMEHMYSFIMGLLWLGGSENVSEPATTQYNGETSSLTLCEVNFFQRDVEVTRSEGEEDKPKV